MARENEPLYCWDMVEGVNQPPFPPGKRPEPAKASRCSDNPASPEQAFVVQIADARMAAKGLISGRVEHMLSGECAHFETQHQLISFFRRVLSAKSDDASVSSESRRDPNEQ
jgi:hypothetical protein